MIPLRLTFKGLYSYRDTIEHSIDFTRLTEARLFGIFGPVGSGKSTILEAMAFALYEETERLNLRGDDRYYNMMNLKSTALLIRFDFKPDEDEDTEYRAEVSSRRGARSFQKVSSIKRRFFEKVNGEWRPAERSIESILGLSYENFRRAVIIPQGKFQEFLQLSGTERTQMMKELFHLQRFDLSEKARRILSRTLHEKSQLEGRLLELGEVDEAHLKQIADELSSRKEAASAEAQSLSALQENEKLLLRRKEAAEQRQAAEGLLAGLSEQIPSVDQREKRLRRFRFCVNEFKPLLDSRQTIVRRKSAAMEDIERKQPRLAEVEAALQQAAAQLAPLRSEGTATDRERQTAQEFRILSEVCNDTGKLDGLRDELLDIDEQSGELTRVLVQMDRQIENEAEKRETLRSMLEELSSLSQLREWYAEDHRRDAELTKLRNSLNQVKERSDALGVSREKTLMPLTEQGWLKPLELRLPPETLSSILKSSAEQLSGKVETAMEKLRETDQTHLLETLARPLNAGDPCPLCGATDHPLLYHQPAETAKIRKQQQKGLLALRNELQALSDVRITLGELIGEEKSLTARRVSLEQELLQALDALKRHRSAFHWDGYDPNSEDLLHQRLGQLESAEKELRKLEERVSGLQKEKTRQQERLAELEKKRSGLQNRQTELETRIKTTHASLTVIDAENYRDHTAEDLIELADASERAHTERVTRITQLEADIIRRKEERARIGGELELLQQQSQTLSAETDTVDAALALRIEDSEFESIEEVFSILNYDIEIDQEQEAIATFRQQIKSVESQLEQLRHNNRGTAYDAAAHDGLLNEISGVKSGIDELIKRIGALESMHTRMHTDLAARREVTESLLRIEKRIADLNTLQSLFRGAGFVNYVSTIYLRNLVNAANNRFRTLTLRQLELELTEDNSFQVRDFLNGGSLRSIKTLSGGQTFQAALCLALALSDNIHTPEGKPHHFFFLDEGFGTLDRETLQVVLNTLKSLRKEKRVVGLISHVEELQQEIDVHLRIIRDDATGSRIVQ